MSNAPETERTLKAETKLYYDLRVSQRDAPAPLLIALHGYGSNKGRMMRDALASSPEGFAVASLQGPHQHLKEAREEGGPLRYGFGWLTNFHPEDSVALHHRALLDLVETLVSEKVARRDAIFLLGFSQTCALNFRFAFTHAKILRGAIGVCGGLPGDWKTGPQYAATDAAILYLHGTRDEFYPPERVSDYGELLSSRAKEVETKAYDAGHEMNAQMREDVRAWLKARA